LGKSKGVANVGFFKLGDAHKAYLEYHNRPLDNKPMKIELLVNPESAKIKSLEGGIQSRLGGGVAKKKKEKP
jgi:RNA recognition motif-containing protein